MIAKLFAMAIAKMDTTITRAYRHVKDNLYVEVVMFYLNLYDGLGNKTSSRLQKEELRQTFFALHPETKGITGNTGMELYEFPDGTTALMVGTGRDLNGNLI